MTFDLHNLNRLWLGLLLIKLALHALHGQSVVQTSTLFINKIKNKTTFNNNNIGLWTCSGDKQIRNIRLLIMSVQQTLETEILYKIIIILNGKLLVNQACYSKHWNGFFTKQPIFV